MKHILVVEDDSFLNKMLSYNLTADGYEITSVLNARTAAQALSLRECDLVLLDINLPDGNGYDLCKLIKPEYPDTIVIFLTANDQESAGRSALLALRLAFSYGFILRISKPVSAGIGVILLPPRQSFARSPLRRDFQRPNCVECRRYSSLLSSFSSVCSGMAAASFTISVISCWKSLAFWEVITGFPVVSSISFRVFPAIEPPFCATF